jgi:hypothetical protein
LPLTATTDFGPDAIGWLAVYWILFYEVVDDYVERRRPLRDRHLARAQEAYQRGELLLAGALAEPADGAVLVFKASSAAVAEQFARDDPYVKEGLVTSWRIRQWTVVVGEGIDPPA